MVRLQARQLLRFVATIAIALSARDVVAQAPHPFTREAEFWDVGSSLAVRLMTLGCIDNHADATAVRIWAEKHRYLEVTETAVFKQLAGAEPGNTGWALPTRFGTLVISTRAATKECIVYAEKAQPTDVRALFAKEIDAARGPRFTITTTEDPAEQTARGAKRVRRYKVVAIDEKAAVLFVVATIEHPGGLYQAMLDQQPVVDGSPVTPNPGRSR